MREYTYNPAEGEFVDFATLDDWKQRDDELRAEIARLQAEVERLTRERDEAREGWHVVMPNANTAWNDAIEAAAHLIECDGDAMNGKADAARLIRALKRPTGDTT